MTKKYNQTKSPAKGWIMGTIAGGLTALGYSALFPLYKWPHYLLMAAAVLVVGRVFQVMGGGLDTTHQASTAEDLPVTGNEQVDRIVKKGQELLTQIRQEDDLIPDPVLSDQIVQLNAISNKIFRTVIDQPAKAPQIRRFLDYYLPTTLKMLRGYRTMDERKVQGAEANALRDRIRSAMDVVIGAFNKQLQTLYKDDILDISTDIDVLETMLKQDSLVSQPFTSPVGSGSAGAQAQAQKEE